MPKLRPLPRTQGHINKPNKPIHAAKNSDVEGGRRGSDAVKGLGQNYHK